MTRVCKLCAIEKRSAIDRFIAAGHSFKEFRRKFPKLKVSIYIWSRHKAHIGDRVEDDGGMLIAGLNDRNLRTIHRSLRSLAARQAKMGKPAAAISAYATLLKCEQMLADRNAAQKPAAQPAPVAKTLTEIQARVIEICRDPMRAEFVLVCLHKAGHKIIGRLENISTPELIRQLEACKELRERVRHCLIEADAVEIPTPVPRDYVVPGTGGGLKVGEE
jgi:hypothetical protein